MICPYCKKQAGITKDAILLMKTNAEYYGSSHFHIRCEGCKKMIGIPIYRSVVVGELYQSNEKGESF